MSKEKFYKCIPELNKECKKSNCFINGGECENTIYKEYTLKGLLEKIERLNNIINESDKMIDKIVEEVYKPVDKEWDNILCIIEDYKLKLQELKGSDK